MHKASQHICCEAFFWHFSIESKNIMNMNKRYYNQNFYYKFTLEEIIIK